MDASIATRRAFVGSAILGTALLLPLARRGTPDTASVTDMTGVAARSFVSAASEMPAWVAAIGETFLIAGATGPVRGTLVDVVADRHDPATPATMRTQSFWAHFTVDAATAPPGDAIYTLDHPVAGRSELFLMRSADRAGRAVLKALFN